MNEDRNCQSTKFIKPVYEEQKCQSTVCFNKKCHVNMWPVKQSMDMQLPKPALPYKYTRLCNNKSCQSTRCCKKSEYTKCDKNCQSTQYMWLKKPTSNMWSVTKSSSMSLSKPTRKQVIYKNCTRKCVQ